MAPPKFPEHTIDETAEYKEFIQKLVAFHESRGTRFEEQPRVGNTSVDLLKLFNHVVANGGYDTVTSEKLLWRKTADDLGLHSNNEASIGYHLKTVFYRFLAAYEIATVHKKEPPPPEILEHITAKGGGLLSRTMENFLPPGRRDGKGDPSDASGDEATPSRDRRTEEPPATGRAGRGLREAPPQRVLFQPDTAPARAARQQHQPQQPSANNASATSSGTPTSQSAVSLPHQPHHSHQHHYPAMHPPAHTQAHANSHPHAMTHSHINSQPTPNAQPQPVRGLSWNPSSIFSSTVEQYTPKLPGTTSIPLRPVETPGTNPAEFARIQRAARQQATQSEPLQPQPPKLPLPQRVFEGPGIYDRCVLALRSGVYGEEAFALNHLLRISYERGDKFKFDTFPGLAEGLVNKGLRVSGFFHDVDWTVSYNPDQDEIRDDELDGINGTPDLLEKLGQLLPRRFQEGLQPAEFCDQMTLITEAILTIRNMVVMLPENARFLSQFPPLKDLVTIILHLPNDEAVTEVKHYALDIAEQVTPHLTLDAGDPLYRTLLAQLNSNDRGTILTALRAAGQISMNLDEPNRLSNVPPPVLRKIISWLLLNDDELIDCCLDFLYQYTAVVANVESLLDATKPEDLASHLVRLLSHGAKRVQREQVLEPERKVQPKDIVAPIPSDLLEQLLPMDEPSRCLDWLRCFFEEDPDSSITQIAIWNAYQNAFRDRLSQQGRQLIGAAEFIRNISSVYTSAGAQILREQGDRGEIQKFIIKGIRARDRPTNPDGREYFPCLWEHSDRPAPQKCGNLCIDDQTMFDHILADHLTVARGEDGRFGNQEGAFRCKWASCQKFASPTQMRLSRFMSHVKTHVISVQFRPGHSPNNSSETATRGSGSGSSAKRSRRPWIVPAKTVCMTFEETPMARDERNPNAPPQAAGIPLSAVLVLRNIARNVVKTESEESLLKQHERGGEGGGWNERLFRPVLPRLYEVMTENRVFAPYIISLFQLIEPS